MKVRELIEKLSHFDPDAEVLTEGCDCYGDTADVVEHVGTTTVLIARGDNSD